MEIEKLIERLQNWDGIKPDREIDCAIEGLKALQAENDRLKEIIFCYCDMCIEQDGVLWCQSCDEKCDYCIHPKEASHD